MALSIGESRMGITSGVYRKYTVIVEGMGRDDMPGYHYVEAMTKEGAIALAKKLQYNDEHIGWDAEQPANGRSSITVYGD